jgi:hypothetical protein
LIWGCSHRRRHHFLLYVKNFFPAPVLGRPLVTPSWILDDFATVNVVVNWEQSAVLNCHSKLIQLHVPILGQHFLVLVIVLQDFHGNLIKSSGSMFAGHIESLFRWKVMPCL